MSKAALQTLTRESTVKLIDSLGNPQQKKFQFFTRDGEVVPARKLKKGLLKMFSESPYYEDSTTDENSAAFETESEAEADSGYHLTAHDKETGKPRALSDDENVDLGRYTNFELSPQTAGGDQGSRS
jgi:hypothetical protein